MLERRVQHAGQTRLFGGIHSLLKSRVESVCKSVRVLRSA